MLVIVLICKLISAIMNGPTYRNPFENNLNTSNQQNDPNWNPFELRDISSEEALLGTNDVPPYEFIEENTTDTQPPNNTINSRRVLKVNLVRGNHLKSFRQIIWSMVMGVLFTTIGIFTLDHFAHNAWDRGMISAMLVGMITSIFMMASMVSIFYWNNKTSKRKTSRYEIGIIIFVTTLAVSLMFLNLYMYYY